MTDIVIPLGTGSPWQNNELRYTLRSVEKHLQGYRNVYLVGEKPDWIQDVIHIPFKEINLASVREANICNKVIAACGREGLSNDFLFMNDDHFLMEDSRADQFPNFFCGMIRERVVDRYNPYSKSIANTLKLLGQDALNFDMHCPVLFNQSAFLHVMNRVDWGRQYGYLMKSIYCNKMGVKAEYLPDLKINERLDKIDILVRVCNRPFFSVGNAGLNDAMKEVLQMLYPVKSSFECST